MKETEGKSYFKPWRLPMIYEVEPGLEKIANWAASQREQRYQARLETYEKVKAESDKLIGWRSRDPRLRCSEAWDCFMRHIVRVLKI